MDVFRKEEALRELAGQLMRNDGNSVRTWLNGCYGVDRILGKRTQVCRRMEPTGLPYLEALVLVSIAFVFPDFAGSAGFLALAVFLFGMMPLHRSPGPIAPSKLREYPFELELTNFTIGLPYLEASELLTEGFLQQGADVAIISQRLLWTGKLFHSKSSVWCEFSAQLYANSSANESVVAEICWIQGDRLLFSVFFQDMKRYVAKQNLLLDGRTLLPINFDSPDDSCLSIFEPSRFTTDDEIDLLLRMVDHQPLADSKAYAIDAIGKVVAESGRFSAKIAESVVRCASEKDSNLCRCVAVCVEEMVKHNLRYRTYFQETDIRQKLVVMAVSVSSPLDAEVACSALRALQECG